MKSHMKIFLPCYYVGMLFEIFSLSALVGIPFCIREYLVGKSGHLFMFLQVIADTLPWFLCSILCCTCLSVRITKKYHSSLPLV